MDTKVKRQGEHQREENDTNDDIELNINTMELLKDPNTRDCYCGESHAIYCPDENQHEPPCWICHYLPALTLEESLYGAQVQYLAKVARIKESYKPKPIVTLEEMNEPEWLDDDLPF